MAFNGVLETAKKRFLILKFFGLASITIINDKSVTKLKDLLYLLVNLTVGLILFFVAFTNQKEFRTSNLEIINDGNVISYLGAIVISLIATIVFFVFLHKSWEMILIFHEIDRSFGQTNLNFTFIRRILKAIFLSVAGLAIPVGCVVLYRDRSIFKLAIFFYFGIFYLSSCAAIITMNSGIFLRVHTINFALVEMFKGSKNPKNFCSEGENIETISRFIEIYGKLVKVNRLMNLCYSIQAMLGFGILYFYSVFTLFAVFKDLNDKGTLEAKTFNAILRAGYMQIFSATMIYFCTLSERETGETLKLVNSILNRSKCETMSAILIRYGTLVKENKPKFTCGLFDFNWTLIYGVS